MKIVHETKHPVDLVPFLATRQVICYTCKSVLIPDLADMRVSQKRTSDQRGDEYMENSFAFVCPVCNSSVTYSQLTSNEKTILHAAIRLHQNWREHGTKT